MTHPFWLLVLILESNVVGCYDMSAAGIDTWIFEPSWELMWLLVGQWIQQNCIHRVFYEQQSIPYFTNHQSMSTLPAAATPRPETRINTKLFWHKIPFAKGMAKSVSEHTKQNIGKHVATNCWGQLQSRVLRLEMMVCRKWQILYHLVCPSRISNYSYCKWLLTLVWLACTVDRTVIECVNTIRIWVSLVYLRR